MPATTMVNSDVLAVQLETVTQAVSEYYEHEDALVSRFAKMVSHDQSSRDMRIPIPMYPGGKFRQISFEGDFGRGSGEHFEYAAVAPIETAIALELSDKVIYTTNSTAKAVTDVVARQVAMGLTEYKLYKDKLLQTAGTGILGTISSIGGTGNLTWTMASPFYVQLLRYGQEVSVYTSSSQTALRGNGVATIVGIDTVNNTITVDANPSGVAANDVVCVGGLTATPPTSIYGLAYHHSSAATGYWLGLNRATFPGLRTPTVTASGTLTTNHMNRMFAGVTMGLGQDVMDTGRWFIYLHTTQRMQWAELGQLISEITLNQGNAPNGNVDILMDRKRAQVIGGIEVVESIHADRTRIDLIDADNWIRGTYKEIGIHDMAGQPKIALRGTSGGYGGGQLWYITAAEQFAVKNPRRGAYINTLTEVSVV